MATKLDELLEILDEIIQLLRIGWGKTLVKLDT